MRVTEKLLGKLSWQPLAVCLLAALWTSSALAQDEYDESADDYAEEELPEEFLEEAPGEYEEAPPPPPPLDEDEPKRRKPKRPPGTNNDNDNDDYNEPPPPPPDEPPPPPGNYGNDGNRRARDSDQYVDGEDREPVSEATRYVERKTFSLAEVQAYCKRYNGRMISYYADIYKVQNCQLRKIKLNNTVYKMQLDGWKIITVEGDVIAALPKGEPLDLVEKKNMARGCKELEGEYVTYSFVDTYFVEKCKKRIFPDWETFSRHRSQRRRNDSQILALSLVEFSNLRRGAEIPSVMDAHMKDLLYGDAGSEIDIIPLSEACRGVNGKVVAYYSKLYRIENCRKRMIEDPAAYTKQNLSQSNRAVVELNTQQWLSMPDGVPINNAPQPSDQPQRYLGR